KKYALYSSFFKERSVDKRDSVLKIYLKTFPGDRDWRSDLMVEQVAILYLQNQQVARFNSYKPLVRDSSYLVFMANDMIRDFADKGILLAEDEILAKEAVELQKQGVDNAVSSDYLTVSQVRRLRQENYDGYRSVYNYILFKSRHVAEALE